MSKKPDDFRYKNIEKIVNIFNGPFNFNYSSENVNLACGLCHQIIEYRTNFSEFRQFCTEHYEKHQAAQLKNAINSNSPVIVVNNYIGSTSDTDEALAKKSKVSNEKLSESFKNLLSRSFISEIDYFRCKICSELLENNVTQLIFHIENHESNDQCLKSSTLFNTHSLDSDWILSKGSNYYCVLCHTEFLSKRQHLASVRHRKTEEISLEYSANEHDYKTFLADISQLCIQLNLSGSKLRFLKPFLEKYTGRHVPSVNTLRKYINVLKNTPPEATQTLKNGITEICEISPISSLTNEISLSSIAMLPQSEIKEEETPATLFSNSGEGDPITLNEHNIIQGSINETDGLRIIEITDLNSLTNGTDENQLHEIIVTDSDQVTLDTVLIETAQNFENHNDFLIFQN